MMKICFALLAALGILLMGLGQMQRAYEEAKWAQALNLLGGYFYDPPRLISTARIYETTYALNSTTVLGFVVFLVSSIGLLLCFARERAASKPMKDC